MKKSSEHWRKSPYLAEVRLVYQTNKELACQPILSSSEQVYHYLLEIWDMERMELQEEFCVLLFNAANRCLGWHRLCSGGKHTLFVDIAHVVSLAVLANASSIIIAHNHPSGRLIPSTSDLHLTRRIYDALSTLGIRLSDHLIISNDSYYSFNEHNLLQTSGRS